MPHTPPGGPQGAIVKNAVAITEWYSRAGGDVEGCGEAAVAMVLHVLKATSTDPAFVTQLEQEAIAAHEVSDYPHAATTPRNLAWLLKKHGCPAVIHGGDWETAIRANAGILPLIVGVNNATAFGGHDQKVHGHYVCIFGIAADGTFVVGDPNTPEATQGQFVFYSLSAFRAAEPFATLVPNENPLGSIPFLGPALNATLAPVNAQLRHVSGFSDISLALMLDEQIWPMPPNTFSGNWLDIGQVLAILSGFAFGNLKAFVLRSLIVLCGIVLLLAVLIQVLKQSDPQFWSEISTPRMPSLGGAGGTAAMSGAGGLGGAAAGGAGEIPLEAALL